MNALAADIGGTYSRLAWSNGATGSAVDEQRFENAAFASLEAVIDEGLALRGDSSGAIDQMVLAVPGPVHEDPVKLTNIDWQLDRGALRQRYRTGRLLIVNDFQAAALGAIGEPFDRLTVLNAGAPDDGAVVVAGAGTGLGMAWLPSRDAGGLPRATEGGHMDFAPNDAGQRALLEWLAERHGHVSWERVVSGEGLLDGYRFIAGAGDTTPGPGPAEISALATQGDRAARAAVETFVSVLGAYAGNLALAFNPTGGLYLCGGLVTHLADWFDPAAFVTAFTGKGRMSAVVRRIPVFLVVGHDTGLNGARRILKESYRADT